MSFIEWISRRRGFRSLEDSFAINRDSMLVGLRKAILQQQQRCDEVWLVAHFFDTFVLLQEFLGAEEIDYQIVDQAVAGPSHSIPENTQPGALRLALASLITSPPEDGSRTISNSRKVQKLAMIVCERHPLYVHDKRLFEAAKQFDAEMTFGYVLSLDDVVVKQVVSPMAMQVLKQLGLDEKELIASHYLSRLLERRLIRDSQKYSGNHEADSAEQWIKMNLGE